jgi:glutamate---cysteine ligase / carboxylate-amine ligase
VSEPSTILAGVRERFDASEDFTIGIEEEYQLLDPETLALTGRFEDMMAAAEGPFLDRLAGELIASEIEYRTGKHYRFVDAARDLAQGRLDTIALAEGLGVDIGVTGVHPFSRWEDQRIIDTEHYRRVEAELGYAAWTNNTWSVHLHCGIRGADRAVQVSTVLRNILPELLALSANSAVFWGRPTRLHSTRTHVFTRNFPRCGIPDPFANFDEYAEFVRTLERSGSIVEGTQLWWSVRPHHTHGTVEVRVCDGQNEMGETLALAALMLAACATAAAEIDEGRTPVAHPYRLIEENLWRAERRGLTGELIDLERGEAMSTVGAIEALMERVQPAAARLGLETFLRPVASMLDSGNGAVRQLRRFEETGGDLVAMHRENVERTRISAQEVLEQIGTHEQ